MATATSTLLISTETSNYTNDLIAGFRAYSDRIFLLFPDDDSMSISNPVEVKEKSMIFHPSQMLSEIGYPLSHEGENLIVKKTIDGKIEIYEIVE